MKAAEHHAPHAPPTARIIRIDIGPVTAVLVVLLALAPFVGWLALVDDPLGGEPVASVAIAPAPERRGGEGSAGAAISNAAACSSCRRAPS